MYDHYIAVDWAQNNMAIAIISEGKPGVFTADLPSDLKTLQDFLGTLKGKKILTVEELNQAQWLYVELRGFVDEIIICDPYRNRLLSEGVKTDIHDAVKLVQLLKAGLLKAVFHSGDEIIRLRKLISAYDDLVTEGVSLKNQRSALYRSVGKRSQYDDLTENVDLFVLKRVERRIEEYELQKSEYEREFVRLSKTHRSIRLVQTISGIGAINSVKLVARVVDAKRFKTKGHFLSYSGLIKLDKISGGVSYGRRNPRYCRTMKSVFKTAAISAIHGRSNNVFRQYYESLLRKGLAEFQARHAVARRIAVISYGVLKTGEAFSEKKLKLAD